MAYPSYLSQFMPQMGLLSGMYGAGAAGSPGGNLMPMQNAAPQLPTTGMGGGGMGMAYAPHLTGPAPPGGATPGAAGGGNPLAGLNPQSLGMLKQLFMGGSTPNLPGNLGGGASQLPNGVGDYGAMSVADLAKPEGYGGMLGWLRGLGS